MHDDTSSRPDTSPPGSDGHEAPAPEAASKASGFAALGLAPAVLEAVEVIGYEQPSPIQSKSIPHLLAGRDLLGIAQTGTGKTAAFALPLLSRIDLGKTKPQVLVLTPTRELAIQVSEAFQRYASHLKGFHIVPIYGGQEYGGQLRHLHRGVHAVVGTPGRIMDHLRRGSLVLDELQTLVLDEADEMLRMGFLEDIEWILQHTPEARQTALFSATMPRPIQKVAETYMKDPAEVRIVGETVTVEHTKQHACLVQSHAKLDALTRLLETADFDGMLVFVRTKTATVELAERIEARGFACDALNGDMTQQARERTVGRFRSGALDILIATDVAARGIDVPRISHVVNFDIPYDAEGYIHRVGRTGRAGRDGMAITFVTPRESRLLHAIERATRSPIEWLAVPGHEQLAEHRIQAFKRQMKDVLEGDEELAFFRQLIRDFAAENGCSTEDAAAALAFQLQRKRPLQPPPDRIVPQRPPRPQRERAVRPGGQERGRDGGARRPRAVESDLESFRIDVGREHGVNPSHIVGAIANEIGLDSGRIGRIQLYDTHSTVDLPRGMPDHVLKHLQQVRIFQRPLAIQRVADHSTPGSPGSRSFEDRTPVHPPDRSDKKRDGSRPVKNRARPAGPSVLVAPSTPAPETDGSSLPAKRLVKKKRPADDKPKRFDKGKKLGAKSKGPKKNRKDRNKGKPKRKEP